VSRGEYAKSVSVLVSLEHRFGSGAALEIKLSTQRLNLQVRSVSL
jgi:hypothetical protein